VEARETEGLGKPATTASTQIKRIRPAGTTAATPGQRTAPETACKLGSNRPDLREVMESSHWFRTSGPTQPRTTMLGDQFAKSWRSRARIPRKKQEIQETRRALRTTSGYNTANPQPTPRMKPGQLAGWRTTASCGGPIGPSTPRVAVVPSTSELHEFVSADSPTLCVAVRRPDPDLIPAAAGVCCRQWLYCRRFQIGDGSHSREVDEVIAAGVAAVGYAIFHRAAEPREPAIARPRPHALRT
jgi:hypothetical protein